MIEIKNDEQLAILKHKKMVSGLLRLDSELLLSALSMVSKDEALKLSQAISLISQANALICEVGFNYSLPADVNKAIALYEAMSGMDMFKDGVNPHARRDGTNYGRD